VDGPWIVLLYRHTETLAFTPAWSEKLQHGVVENNSLPFSPPLQGRNKKIHGCLRYCDLYSAQLDLVLLEKRVKIPYPKGFAI